MTKQIIDNQIDKLVRVELKCGRDYLLDQNSNNYDDSSCGSWEDNTNNHTAATCC